MGFGDGGETGLFSLNKAMGNDEYQVAQDLGFFRDDAALVVIFVADEQDICAEYPDGILPVPDPDKKRNDFFYRLACPMSSISNEWEVSSRL